MKKNISMLIFISLRFRFVLAVWALLLGLISSAFGATTVESAPLQNQLKDHPAPYLALHGDDPVAWQEWGPDVLKRATAENKIILVSVGYFACHWCHVMQRESYQNDEVAAILNDNFISVKVDRELDTALDNRLMNFAQSTIGRGGWPLNVFITPDGYPIYALLYAPKEQFEQVLLRLQTVWINDSEKVRNIVNRNAGQIYPATDANLDYALAKKYLDQSVDQILGRADTFQGGFGSQNKFPSAPQLEYLIDQLAQNANADRAVELGDFLTLTLDAMASLGLNDHLGGGFFRYTVDPNWEIPHFEKMLYDNAQIATVFAKAGELFNREDYHQVARETLDFMRRDMWLDGALVAAFSAVDDDGIEGAHYLWQRQQLSALLNEEEQSVINSVWGMNRDHELDSGNHVRTHQTLSETSKKLGISVEQTRKLLFSARRKMLGARGSRPLPVDDKLLAGWNGLALKAFALGAEMYQQQQYTDTANALAEFLTKTLWNGKELTRAKVKNEIFGIASLEDYAYVSHSLWRWGQISKNGDYQEVARQIAATGWKLFYKGNAWYRESESLLANPVGIDVMEEGATASPAAVLITSSLEIAHALNDTEWQQFILTTLNRGQNYFDNNSFWYVSQLSALQLALDQQQK